MLKIIKYGCEYNIPNSAIANVSAAYDGIRVILNDRTEMNFNMSVSNQIKAIIPIIQTTTAKQITLNLDAAISGNYDKVLSLQAEEPKPVVQQIITIQNTTPVDNTKTTSTKKKGGRPPKNTAEKK